jgi:hypothetical protein
MMVYFYQRIPFTAEKPDMNLNDYHQFTQTLIGNIQQDPRVIGLVALGSMAEQGRVPDAWSDHDFFVIVQSGTQEDFRQSQAWLPHPEKIVLAIRETEHGLKVLYDTPHLIEFAVFDANELHSAKANDYKILVNKGDIEQIMVQISAPRPKPAYNPTRDMTMVLALLYVGAGRYARGEMLSAHVFIKHHTLHHLLPLLIHLLDGDTTKLDNLDPFRRFEQFHPDWAEALNGVLVTPIIDCAITLFSVLTSLTDPLHHPNTGITPHPYGAIQTVWDYLHHCKKSRE